MADAVNAGFARSEHLKKEWAALKREMLAVDPDTPDAAARRQAIHNRMDQVMSDMADVLTETRRLIPTPDIDSGDDDDDVPAPPPPQDAHIQYSARHLHIVHRTYDSSDDDDGACGPHERDLRLKLVHAPKLPDPDDPDAVDVRSLRQHMMEDASPDAVITVEGKGLRAGLKGLKDKLRKPETPVKDRARHKDPDNDSPSPPPESPRGKPLSTDDREELALEQSRLERESRRLKRKPERTPTDNSRLEDIANRLSRISSTLADAADTHDFAAETAPVTPEKPKSPILKKGPPLARPQRPDRATPQSPHDDDDDLTFDTVDEDASPRASRSPQTQKPAASKRKKGWMALEAGVASFRALGRSVRNSAAAARESRTEAATPSPARNGGKLKAVQRNAGGNAFTETSERLHERGERLNNTAEGAEQMANDAGDMLAAVRALRQRKEKGGFFS